MSMSMKKITTLGRHKLESSLEDIFGNISTAQYCLSKLRQKVRTFLLTITAGEAIHADTVKKSEIRQEKGPNQGVESHLMSQFLIWVE